MSQIENLSKELQRIYANRFDKMRGYRDAVWKILTRDYFQNYVSENSRILDLGCGYGEFINNIVASKKYAMDLNETTKLHLNQEVEFIQQDCSSRWPLADETLDVVFTSNFFEHLPDKATLGRTLDEVYRCLAPGGRLIAMGPNIRYVPGAYWDFWDHYLSLTELSLGEGMINRGFEMEKQIPRFLPYTMARGRQLPLFLLKIFLCFTFLWPLFGRQFLVVGVKK